MSPQPATRDIREVIAACELTETWLGTIQAECCLGCTPASVIVEAELRFQAQRVSHVTPSENDEQDFFNDLARRYAAAANTLWALSLMRAGEMADAGFVRDARKALDTVAKLRRYHTKRLGRVPGQPATVIDSIPGSDTAIDGAGNAVAYTGDE